MSSKKRGGAADGIYNTFMYGNFSNNPATNRTALMERMYIRLLSELAANRFKWSGMPSSIDIRFLEMTLFYSALSIFYFDKRYDKFFALKGGGTNWNNMMDNPVGFSVVGANFTGMNISAINETEKAGIAIPIWANYQRMPDLDIVLVYANKLSELDRTIEINSLNARRSKVVASNENQRLSWQNINRQIDEGQNHISVTGNVMDMAAVVALDLGIDPKSIEALHILRTRLWNECMGLLGIENANQDKKERLVADEVDANNDQTSMMRFVNLNARRSAAEQINEIYGLKVEVEYYTDIERMAANSMPEIGTNSGDNNE